MTNLRLKGSARQRAWERLRQGPVVSIQELADAARGKHSGIAGWVRVLCDAGYIRRDQRGLTLTNNTGPRAPSVSTKTGTITRDWNLDLPIDHRRLRAVVHASGLSFSGWLKAHGLHPSLTTKLREMMDGGRPITARIQAAVEDDERADQ